jgi:hypothetical protein
MWNGETVTVGGELLSTADADLTRCPSRREEAFGNLKIVLFLFFFIRKIVLFLIFSHFFSFGSLTFVRRTFLLWNDSVKRLLIL